MLFDITKLSDKLEAMTDFIPVYKIKDDAILFVNKNNIKTFIYTKNQEKECLTFNLKYNKNDSYQVCKEDNPIAFNELFKGIPERLPIKL